MAERKAELDLAKFNRNPRSFDSDSKEIALGIAFPQNGITPGEGERAGKWSEKAFESAGVLPTFQTRESELKTAEDLKVYKRRYWMLAIFSVCSMLNAAQWIQYAVIEQVIVCYYNVTVEDVNLTSLVYMISYIPIFYPVSLYLSRFGPRTAVLTGSLMTCAGTIVQCFAQEPDGFPIALASQVISAVAQVFIVPIPPKLAAVWFGHNEVCRATAVGALANQVGVALGFIFTPLMAPYGCSEKQLVKRGRSIVAYTLTGLNIAVFVLLVLTFQRKPERPPSLGEAVKNDEETRKAGSMLKLMKNCNFFLLFNAYGLILGTLFGISTVLNQMITMTMKDVDREIGGLGLTLIFSGLGGSFTAGYVLDRTHKFKETSLAVFLLTLASMAAFAGCLYLNTMWVLFLAIFVMGFFLSSYVPVGFEYAVEITYPASEATTASLLNASVMIYGIIGVMLPSYLLTVSGRMAANLFFCGCILVGTICIACIRTELRRTNANAANGTVAAPPQ